MAVNVAEFMNKIQEEGLTALKQTQEASLSAMGDFRKFANELTEKPGTIPAFENLPTPTQLVELSFGFASQFLELRKAYTLKVAEMIVEAQKQAEATASRAALSRTSTKRRFPSRSTSKSQVSPSRSTRSRAPKSPLCARRRRVPSLLLRVGTSCTCHATRIRGDAPVRARRLGLAGG